MIDHYPGYDVLAKRATPSWDETTRSVIDRRLSLPDSPRYLSLECWATLTALAARIVPQPERRTPIPVEALIDDMLLLDRGSGFRNACMPKLREAWIRGLCAVEVEAQAAHGAPFGALLAGDKDRMVGDMRDGELASDAWGDMPPKLFFSERLIPDLLDAYYAHPSAWSAIGFGGPASPRGYVRLGPGLLDPWEAVLGG